MTPDLNSVFNDALLLPAEQQKELAEKLLHKTQQRVRGRGDITKFFGMIDSGDPRSADNDRIDADLAKAYADNHDPKK